MKFTLIKNKEILKNYSINFDFDGNYYCCTDEIIIEKEEIEIFNYSGINRFSHIPKIIEKDFAEKLQDNQDKYILFYHTKEDIKTIEELLIHIRLLP